MYKHSRLKTSTLLLAAGAAAIALLVLSWPRLQASLTYLPVDTALKNYYASREIPTLQLPALIERTRQAITRHDHYRYRDGLSTLYYLRGLDQRSPSRERRPAFEQAITEAQNAVAAAPARPLAWQRIARTHALLGHGPDKVIPPLKMSIYAGRVEPTLLIGRLELGYRYLTALDDKAVRPDDEMSGLLRDQTLLGWKIQPRELSRAIEQQRIPWQGIQDLLGGRNDRVLQEMEVSLGRAVQ